MTAITVAQQKFLEHHKIPASRVFDAAGMCTKDFLAAMSSLGMLVAIGVSPCAKAGHKMRWKSNHCAECNPHSIRFKLRYEESGVVYVAYSRKSRLTKVGSSLDPAKRMASLNQFKYGGASDWSIQFEQSCEAAGRVEFDAQNRLKANQTNGTYFRGDVEVACRELFECDMATAISAVKAAAAGRPLKGYKDPEKVKVAPSSTRSIPEMTSLRSQPTPSAVETEIAPKRVDPLIKLMDDPLSNTINRYKNPLSNYSNLQIAANPLVDERPKPIEAAATASTDPKAKRSIPWLLILPGLLFCWTLFAKGDLTEAVVMGVSAFFVQFLLLIFLLPLGFFLAQISQFVRRIFGAGK